MNYYMINTYTRFSLTSGVNVPSGIVFSALRDSDLKTNINNVNLYSNQWNPNQ